MAARRLNFGVVEKLEDGAANDLTHVPTVPGLRVLSGGGVSKEECIVTLQVGSTTWVSSTWCGSSEFFRPDLNALRAC